MGIRGKVPEGAGFHAAAGVAASVAAVVAVTAVIAGLDRWIPVLSLGVLYLFAVLPIAAFWGLTYAIGVSVASMLAFNFFFLEPIHTLTLADSRNWLALLVFVATSVVVSELAARSRRRAREASLLAEIATSLLEHGTVGDELERISDEAARALHAERAEITLGPEVRDGFELTASGRRVGTIRLEGGGRDASTRRRVLPALASLLGVAIDRERLEREAYEAEALRRADAIKTALLRAVSHDLRTPLMAISTSAGALARPDLAIDDADRADLLATILAASDRLDHLVGNLLDLSRLQAGAADPEQELIELEELVAAALEELGADRVEVSLPDESPAVSVDPHQIQRVLVNLLENALKYSPAGRACESAGCGDRVGGVGTRDRPRAGHPRRRARADLRALPAGRAGGRSARRRPRPRNRPWFHGGKRRPSLGRVALGPGGDLRPHLPCRPRAGHGLNGAPRVLVVDDEQQILRALRTSLRGAGYQVETAETAEWALAAAAMRPPEAVILDLVLPDGTGIEVCRELRKWSSAPVIVLSAVGEEREKVAALDAGADDYVTKPVGIDELLARLRAVLRRRLPDGGPVLEVGELLVDLEKHTVTMAGAAVHLTPHEFELLRVLAANEGKLLTHRTLLQEVWGPSYGSESNLLHVNISQLRRKIEPDRARPRYLLTEPGAGYRLVNPLDEA